MARKLISSDEAYQGKCQHIKPCSDCPWRRDAINGWLGGNTVDEWVKFAHSDVIIPCHVIDNQQCAGAAIYRRNVAKLAWPPNIKLEADRETVFASPMEFIKHHTIKSA